MREQLPDATIIVDAGVGTASDAAIAMELGADAVLMNTAIAEAQDSAKMAEAMKLAIRGRTAGLPCRPHAETPLRQRLESRHGHRSVSPPSLKNWPQ